MMKRLAVLATMVLVAMTLATPARSQDPGRIQSEISRTDERIDQARTIVAGSGNARAEIALNAAVNLQSESKRLFASAQFPMALRVTLDARLRADASIAFVRGQPDPERVRLQVERTRELIDRARQRIEECTDERARALLRGAGEMQDRAEAANEGQRYLAALRLTLNAREKAWRALRLCHIREDGAEEVERALHRTDDVIDRARQVLAEGAPPAAESALRQAGELQQRAWAEFRAGRPEASMRLTQSARLSAQRAMRLAGGRL